jgi:hypothetical protein
MRPFGVLILLLLSATVVGQELTVAEVVAAHRAGATEDGILRLIAEAPAVVPLAAADMARLRAAGVSDRVIQAFSARAVPTPAPTPARPDDPRLTEVVRMVNSGLTADVVAAQVHQSGQRYALTVNDLIYLKENKVADVVILALLVSGAPVTPAPAVAPPLVAPVAVAAAVAPAPAPAAVPPIAVVVPQAGAVVPAAPPPAAGPASFGRLLRMTGVFRRESTGTLVLGPDALEWRDDRGAGHNESLPAASLRGVWLRDVALGAGRTVAELRVRTVAGDELTFRDADWASGGSARVAQLYRVLEDRFPAVILREKHAP